jgi:hypothetical protein
LVQLRSPPRGPRPSDINFPTRTLAAPGAAGADATEDAFAAFAASSNAGAWTHIAKDDLIANMRDKVRDPFSVNQGAATPPGGAAASYFFWSSCFFTRYDQKLPNFPSASQYSYRFSPSW